MRFYRTTSAPADALESAARANRSPLCVREHERQTDTEAHRILRFFIIIYAAKRDNADRLIDSHFRAADQRYRDRRFNFSYGLALRNRLFRDRARSQDRVTWPFILVM